MRRFALHWFLAAALVVAQLGLHAHTLSHLDDARYGSDGWAHQTDHDPAACLAFDAAAGGAVAPAAFPLVGEPPRAFAGPGSADPLLPSLALTRFASRAPPAHS